MIALRILHISDLHAEQTKFQQNRLADAFLRNVGTLHDERSIDLAIFSGDLAFSGKREQFQLGRSALIDPLMARLNLAPDRLILVPGNHDVDRDLVDNVYEKGLMGLLTTRTAIDELLTDPTTTERALERLGPWSAFEQDFYSGVARELLTSHGWVRRLEIGGVSVGIAALNTAWRSTGSGEGERGRILLGDRQLSSALERIDHCPVRIVVTHHPLEWLTQFDGDDARRDLERRGAIVLSGHDHLANPSLVISGRGSAVYGRAGCLYDTGEYRNSYTVLDIDLGAREITCTVRSWWPERGEFDAAVDVALGGVLHLPFPSPGGLVPSLPYTQVTRSLLAVVQSNSILADLVEESQYSSPEELLVAPRFYAAPYPELLAARRIAGDSKKIEAVNAEEIVAANRVVVVSGEAETGITSALAWLIGQRFANGEARLPVYMRFSARQGKHVIEDDISEAALRVGLQVTGRPLPPLLVAIDDVNASVPRYLTRLVNHIKSQVENVYVLGCHGDDHLKLVQALADAGIAGQELFLGPFGRREAKQLVRKILRGANTNLVDKIMAVLAENRLPRTPFLMAALTAVLQRQPDSVSISATAVVDAYIDLLLGRMELASLGLPDYRKREHLLQHIAGQLTIRRTFGFDRLDAERMVGNYFRVKGDRHASPGRVIDEFIQRRVLIQVGGIVSFRHPAFQHLFAAKQIRDHAAFAKRVKSDPIGHAEIVSHAAALRRNDRGLLSTVGRATDAAVNDIMAALSKPGLDKLVAVGVEDSHEPKDLTQRLRRTAPLPPEVLEARIDELYERLALVPESPQPQANDLTGLAGAMTAVHLLSRVLVSSDLVDDLELRVDLLKRALEGWSVTALALLTREEQTGLVAKLLRETVLKDAESQVSAEALTKMIRIAVMLVLAIQVLGALGSRQTEALLDSVLDDDSFMSTAIHAFLAVFLAVLLGLAGWPGRLVALYNRHKGHAFVRDAVENIALNKFQDPTTSDNDAAVLERFLTEVLGEDRSGRGRGVIDPHAARNSVATDLRKSRVRARMVRHFANADELEIEDESKFGDANPAQTA